MSLPQYARQGSGFDPAGNWCEAVQATAKTLDQRIVTITTAASTAVQSFRHGLDAFHGASIECQSATVFTRVCMPSEAERPALNFAIQQASATAQTITLRVW